MNTKFYPAWFFTNEKLNNFLVNSITKLNIKKVFAVGAAGDFAFSLLSLLKIDEINLCDIRQMACLTIDFKASLFKKFGFKKILNILSNLKHLKKSGFWYKYSFWQIRQKQNYLLYLTSQQRYENLRKQLNKICLYSGDFVKNLKLFPDKYYDLIYVSNILDSKKYNQDNHLCLEIIQRKLKNSGSLIAVAQNNHKKIKKLIESFGFQIIYQETHKFNIFSSFLGHYSFSFLLFQKPSAPCCYF